LSADFEREAHPPLKSRRDNYRPTDSEDLK